MDQAPTPSSGSERSRLLAALAACFLAMVVVDFFLHAVLLSRWWRATASFWRPPPELFAFIPFAYGAFILYAGGLLWLLVRILGRKPAIRSAALCGALAGLFVGATGGLATFSAVPLPAAALLVFPLSLAAVFTGGAACGAMVLRAPRPWRRFLFLVGIMIVLLALAVVLQNLFFPTPEGQRLRA